TPTWQPTVPAAAADETILRPPAQPVGDPAAPATAAYAPRDVGETVARTALRSDVAAPVANPLPPQSGETVASGAAAASPSPRRSRAGLWTGIAAGVVLLAVVAVAAVAIPGMLGAPAASPQPSHSATAKPVDPIATAVAAPTDLVGTVSGDEVVFTWTNPDPQEGDVYAWGVQALGEDTQYDKVAEPTVTVPAQRDKTCISVLVIRANGNASSEATGCAP